RVHLSLEPPPALRNVLRTVRSSPQPLTGLLEPSQRGLRLVIQVNCMVLLRLDGAAAHRAVEVHRNVRCNRLPGLRHFYLLLQPRLCLVVYYFHYAGIGTRFAAVYCVTGFKNYPILTGVSLGDTLKVSTLFYFDAQNRLVIL